ncbi:hypothetical protein HK104_008993, partial [Borealophlyctis nickersoniae]
MASYRSLREHEEEDLLGNVFGDNAEDEYDPNLPWRERIKSWWEANVGVGDRTRHIVSAVLATIIVLVFVIIVRSGSDSGPAPVPSEPIASNWTDVRLPHWIKPTRYDLDLHVDVEGATFEGTVQISLQILNTTSFVAFHSVGLTVHSAALINGPTPSRNETREDTQYTLLWFDTPLRGRTNHTLKLSFNGTLSNGLSGFYRSTYKGGKNDQETKYIATTQFEPTDARRAFPCLDEPGMKSVFQINMTVPWRYHALSNMPYTDVKDAAGSKRFVFEETKEMSTYLVAYIVSEFESVKGKTDRGVNVAVYTQPGKTDLGRFALTTAIDVLEFYEKTYGIAYPLPKGDLIAIPDFAAGAMENWGLVTYRDTALLVDNATSSAKEKQRVAEVIAHELAHQWFGSPLPVIRSNRLLIFGYSYPRGAQAAHPTWRIEDQFVTFDLLRALDADASRYTHPIAATVHNPEEIREIFDDISYAKGSSVIRMLESYLTTSVSPKFFFDRIHAYLSSHAYSNAETKQLWAAFDTDGMSVGSIMSTWTDQPGYPIITVEDTGNGRVSLKQERFYLSPGNATVDEAQTWQVPFTYAVYDRSGSAGKAQTVVLKEGGPVTIKTGGGAKGVVLGNVGRTGVYRVKYPEETYQEVAKWLEEDKKALSPVDLAGLLNDAL